ncbi:MAG: lipoyl(octanoyl) transferase LipB [Chloroflexota bacterium]|nr:lipoyl(octanoyl) transferase LipB [Chloroflexota bacterium]MDE2942463.1 lipoyl(octanoyl) transferase LipB [Chloroflexota bacterium]MDE3267857.1 lipoyl(octanoyl) transferase LipB [Chloroflexota bacterium]
MASQNCIYTRLGEVDYTEAWDMQRDVARRRADGELPDSLLLLEHPHTYTLGRRAFIGDVLAGDEALRRIGVRVVQADRGGLVTYHGPGQIVGYPIMDVRPLGGPRDYVCALEEVVILTLNDFGLAAERVPDAIGVWVNGEKVASVGVRISRGISTHGFALNVNTDLSYFRHIVPCGMPGAVVGSMESLLGAPVDVDRVAERLVHHFGSRLRRTMVEVEPAAIGARTGAGTRA